MLVRMRAPCCLDVYVSKSLNENECFHHVGDLKNNATLGDSFISTGPPTWVVMLLYLYVILDRSSTSSTALLLPLFTLLSLQLFVSPHSSFRPPHLSPCQIHVFYTNGTVNPSRRVRRFHSETVDKTGLPMTLLIPR